MKYSWEGYFTRRILDRGKYYYKMGFVHDVHLKVDGETFSATVIGSDAYEVKVRIVNNRIKGMHCTCPYAQEGNYCKHEAALLYAIETQKGIKKKPAEVVELFPDEIGKHGGEYQYYQMSKITSRLLFQKDIIEKAEDLINEHKVEIVRVQEYYQNIRVNEEIKVCQVWAKTMLSQGYSGEVSIVFRKDKLLKASCNSARCYKYIDNTYYFYDSHTKESACEHITATLLLADAYIKKHHLGDATDYAAQKLIRECRDLRKQEKIIEARPTEKEKTIKLEPRVTVGVLGDLELSFKIGKEKLYVLKNLKELVECVKSGKELVLGKKQSLSFLTDSFREEDEKYYQYIEREVNDENMRNRHIQSLNENYYAQRYYELSEEIKGSVPLYGRKLDNFFEMCKEVPVPLVRKDMSVEKDAKLIMKQAIPKLYLKLTPNMDENGALEGVKVEGNMPKLLKGEHYQYFLKDNTLNQADDNAIRPLNMLLADEDGHIEMTVGRRNLTEFYRKVLPMLKEFAEVDEQQHEKIEELIQPEAKYLFLIDAPEDNIVCEVQALYGEAECRLAELEQSANGYEAFRDLYEEKEVAELVKKYFPYIDEEEKRYHCNKEEEFVFNLISEGVPALMDIGEVHATERFKRIKIRKKPQVTVGVRVESDLLNLTVSSGEYTEEELLELIGSYRKKKKYHRLKNGDFVGLDNSTMEELSMMMETLKISPKEFTKGEMKLPVYRALYLDKMLEKNDALYAKRDKHFKDMIKNFKTVGDSDYELPESLSTVARNYQKYGYKWLRTIAGYQFGGVLADDMGLGKTMQMIAVLLAAKEEGNLETALIVTPASLVFNWKEEFEKFAPMMKVKTVTGTKTEREEVLARYKDYDVIVTSYDLLKRDIAEYEEKTFSYQVIDEAQYIKTHTTAVAKAVKVIQSRTRFALTGTPIENRLSELWSIFDYLMPGFLYSYEKFRKEIELPIAKNKNESAMLQLKRMVEPFILRRLKGDVLKELPEKLEEVQYVVFEKKQQALYDGQVVRMRKILESQAEDEFNKNKMRILAEITRLRQVCCDPGLYLEDYKEVSAKRAACMELLQSAIEGDHKILVFSQFTSMLELLEQDLKGQGIAYYKITGETKKEERVELVRNFNQNEVPVFLISLKAGGTGLNLTGADIVIHYDPWWNLAAQNQATDRAHRIGQRKQVTVFKLIVKNTIEEKILKLQESKKQLADEILSGQTGSIMSMSKEELYALL